MDFILGGVTYSLTRETVRSALRGRPPEVIREHWVDVDGVRWPPKQALALATGLGRTEFTSHIALRQLRRLGFRTSEWSSSSARETDPDKRVPRRAAAGQSHVPSTPRTEADVIVIGCSDKKASSARPAARLFTGPAFLKGRDYAERAGVPWYVLSAKFGLLAPDEVIAPYDVYLPQQSAGYRAAWAQRVVSQLGDRHQISGLVVEVHAGQAYCEPLEQPLARAGATLVQPLAHLRQGERLAWYSRSTGLPPATGRTAVLPDLAPLLDERNAIPPAAFLAADRTASNLPGLYTGWVDVPGAHQLSAGLGHRVAPGLIYAGRPGGQRADGRRSTNTLWMRVGGMHLGSNRQFSTFRLTLTAALRGERPGSDEEALTRWMRDHLRVAVLALPAEVVLAAEERLLEVSDPPLNLQGRPRTPLREALRRLRSASLGPGERRRDPVGS